MNDRQTEFRVGIVILATLLVLGILIVFFGELPSFSRDQYMLTIRFDEAPGVTVGTPVRKSGILIGRVDLVDLTAMPFPDDAFDTTVATSVFCSVAAPVEGLRELGRVTKPDGQILLVEHVRPTGRLLGAVADILTAITRRVFGFRINRRTEENLAEAGLRIVALRRNGVWREIVARPELDRGAPDE